MTLPVIAQIRQRTILLIAHLGCVMLRRTPIEKQISFPGVQGHHGWKRIFLRCGTMPPQIFTSAFIDAQKISRDARLVGIEIRLAGRGGRRH
jgi:hypothetical protein